MARGRRETEPQRVHAQLDLSEFELDKELRLKILLLRREEYEEQKQVVGIGKKLTREFSPYTLGVTKNEWRVFVWQFGGKSSKPIGKGVWRCFRLDELEQLQLRDGEWRHGSYTGRHGANTCIDRIDSDVAIEPEIRAA